MPAYKRILLKLSGEALMGDDAYGINRETLWRIVNEVKVVADLGIEIGIVIGGGSGQLPVFTDYGVQPSPAPRGVPGGSACATAP